METAFSLWPVLKRTASLAIVLVMVGCSGETDTDTDEKSLSSIEGTGVAASDPPVCGAMSQPECEMFKAVNQVRVANGRGPLGVLNKCVTAAGVHAEDMANRDFFAHDSPTETWQQRMQRLGLSGYALAENIAYGSTNVSTTLNGWMNSSGHRSNILSTNYAATGIGYAQDSLGRPYWVQCFSGASPDIP